MSRTVTCWICGEEAPLLHCCGIRVAGKMRSAHHGACADELQRRKAQEDQSRVEERRKLDVVKSIASAREFLLKYGPSLILDSYTFKSVLLDRAQQGWDRGGAEGLMDAVELFEPDIGRRLRERYEGATK